MRSLFEISEDLHFLEDFLTDTGGEVTEEALEAEIDKWLGDLGEERDTKIDNYCALYRELILRGEARKVEADRMATLASVDTKAGERLKARLFNFFDIHGIDRVDTARFKVTRCNNGGALPFYLDKDMEDSPEKLPEPFRKIIYAPDRTAMTEKLQELEIARLRDEQAKSVWEAFLAEMHEILVALENRPEDDTEEARKELEDKLVSFQTVYAKNRDEYEAARGEYERLEVTIPFARFGTRGKHLRIK